MIRKNVAEILEKHVTLELEGIDRMYLNGYVPNLQTGAAAAFFMHKQFDCRMASTSLVAPMSRRFVASIEQFVADEAVDLVTFRKNSGELPKSRARRSAISGLTARRSRSSSLMD